MQGRHPPPQGTTRLPPTTPPGWGEACAPSSTPSRLTDTKRPLAATRCLTPRWRLALLQHLTPWRWKSVPQQRLGGLLTCLATHPYTCSSNHSSRILRGGLRQPRPLLRPLPLPPLGLTYHRGTLLEPATPPLPLPLHTSHPANSLHLRPLALPPHTSHPESSMEVEGGGSSMEGDKAQGSWTAEAWGHGCPVYQGRIRPHVHQGRMAPHVHLPSPPPPTPPLPTGDQAPLPRAATKA